MTLPVDESLRRFLLHLLPQRFVRLRHFGFLANRRRAALLPLCFQLLESTTASRPEDPTATNRTTAVWTCPRCGGPMMLIERITAAQIRLRSPPIPVTCA